MRIFLALGLAIALASAPLPALAAKKAKPVDHDEAPFPIMALIPCGFATGYLMAGRPERALLAPLGVYAATGAGGVIGFMSAWEKASIKRPAESLFGLFLAPVGGMIVGFGISGGIVLLDQATAAPPAGPWLAPLLSVGTIGAILGAGLIQEQAQSKPEAARTLTSP